MNYLQQVYSNIYNSFYLL